MAYKNWEVIKVSYCEHAGEEVALEAEVVYPASYLPEQAPRIIAHPAAWPVTVSASPAAVGRGPTPDLTLSRSRKRPARPSSFTLHVCMLKKNTR